MFRIASALRRSRIGQLSITHNRSALFTRTYSTEQAADFNPKSLFSKQLSWYKTGDAEYPYQTVYGGKSFRVRINDFPAEPMYSLIHIEDGKQTDLGCFNEWPTGNWNKNITIKNCSK